MAKACGIKLRLEPYSPGADLGIVKQVTRLK